MISNQLGRLWGRKTSVPVLKVEPIKLSTEKILGDMKKFNPKFDLRDSQWRQDPEKFWKEFEGGKYTTDDIRVPERFRDWIIGQDEALRKVDLILLEWIKTLRDVQELEKKASAGLSYSKVLKERPTQNVLLLGEPGTGKSLMIKVVAEELRELYKTNGIELEDVVLVENKVNKFSPLLRYVKPAGIGKKLKEISQIRESMRGRRKSALIYGGLGGLVTVGAALMSFGMRQLILGLIGGFDLQRVLLSVVNTYFLAGAGLVGFPLFILFWFFMSSGGSAMGSLSRSDLQKTINLVVDNDPETTELYENATIISDPLLFGEIEWGAFGTSDVPPYLRAKAGLVHNAHKKLLYIDEIKNLTESQATKLLTVMEDGELPIRAQGNLSTLGGGGGTAGQNVETPPIRSMFFLFAAGNLDILYDQHSILNRMPALRDRFENYGDIILLRDEVETTPLNELLVVQVIRDELYRFQFPPMEGEGVAEIIKYMRRRANNKNSLKLMFRAVIKVLKKSAQLCWDAGDTIIRAKYVKAAIENFTSSIEQQILEHEMRKVRSIKIIESEGKEVGIVNGLTVAGSSRYHQGAGDVVAVESWLQIVDDPSLAECIVTGIVKKDGWDIEDSIDEVRTAIFRMYGIDLEKHCYVHIKFSQARVDGPSAGITMTIALMSWLGDPLVFRGKFSAWIAGGGKASKFELEPVPIRQDIAITGAMQIREELKYDIRVSAVGGVEEKIRAASRWGIGYVILPKENYEQQILDGVSYGGTKPLGASSVMDYFEMLRGDPERALSVMVEQIATLANELPRTSRGKAVGKARGVNARENTIQATERDTRIGVRRKESQAAR